ncbi:hypothetical protein GMB86_14420 [Terrilactibacillus sp. BCM23-1]|uniref:Type II secretion system protein n=1 Tax=Terrilactibacillus tamarindi TaxID=2599694 RepID=A0A6N8CTU4_9BACI|nr:hypothetical protein [Terrilactibacillus tamarindi]MTT33190.1 hypothetical protein [Terrilactibacillus tamarindi]
MRNCKGLFLGETMIGLFILSIAMFTAFPALYHVNVEKQNLHLENFARQILQNQMTRWPNNPIIQNHQISKNNVIFSIEAKDKIRFHTLCVSWKNKRSQPRQVCGDVSP